MVSASPLAPSPLARQRTSAHARRNWPLCRAEHQRELGTGGASGAGAQERRGRTARAAGLRYPTAAEGPAGALRACRT